MVPEPDAQESVAPGHRGTLLGHPTGLYLLFLVEMWERFSFYGMRAILGLYLKCSVTGMATPPEGAPLGFNPGPGWAKEDANNLQGWYGGMAYLLPILGGLIADRMIGTHRSMVVGGLLIALGHISLAVSGMGSWAHTAMGMDIFIFGLVVIIIGTGHFKPSVSVMVNQLYPEKDPRREGAFGIFYMGINVGAFLGTTLCGYLGEQVGWHWGFGCAAVGMLAGLALYLYARPRYLAGIGLPRDGRGAVAPWFILSGLGLSVLVAALFHVGVLKSLDLILTSKFVITPLVIASIVWAVWFTRSQTPRDRGPVTSIFIFMLFNAFFWLAFEQAATSINFFTDEKTQRTLGTFLVPASWFQDINPFGIVLLAPVFGAMWTALVRRRRNPPQSVKIGLGLIWLGLGYIFMVIAGIQANTGVKAAMWLIAATYVLHTIGELFLSPTGLAYVTKAAPKKHVSLLMGIWFISSFLAYVVGGKLAGMVESIEKGETKLPWHFGGQADFFFLFVVLSCGSGLLIILLTPLLTKLTRENEE
jgi:POT family proton-dependent oligopeptide transporter